MTEEETPVEEQAPVEEAAVEQPPQESDQDRNFRRMREQLDAKSQEGEQARQMMASMQQEIDNMKRAAAPKEVDEFEGVDRTDWTTIDQTEKLIKKNDMSFDAKLEKRMAAWEEKRNREMNQLRIKEKYTDMNSVVTKENCAQLRALDQDLADSIAQIPDETAQTMAAYKAIKLMMPKAEQQAATKQRIADNTNQPQSLSSVGGKSPLSQASTFDQGLTPALKKQLWQEMNDCARQR